MNNSGQGQQGTHHWRFVRTAGFDQVLLESGADVMALQRLGRKLWAALTCSASGIEFDARTLIHIDTDKDGRIRVLEIFAAIAWMKARFKNPDDLTRGDAIVRQQRGCCGRSADAGLGASDFA